MEIAYTFYKLLSDYISVVPLFIGLIRIRKLNTAFLFLLAMIFCETVIAIYSKWQATHGIYNLPSLHLMTFLELLLGGVFFYLILHTRKLKRVLSFLAIAFLFYTSINSLLLQGIYEYNQIPRTLEGYLFVLFSFFFFYELLRSPDLIQLSKSASFWAVIAFFTYFGTTQFVHLFSDYTGEHYSSFHYALRQLNRTMLILYYSIFAVSFFILGKEEPSLDKPEILSFK